MTDPDIIRFIRTEIAKQLNVILSGVAGTTTKESEDIEQLFPGMATITSRPVMHPYGISSRAPKGTISVVGRQGEHYGNRLVLGHRDKNRPEVQEGEVFLYNEHGGIIRLKKEGLDIERNGVELLEQLIKLLTTIINARTNTIFGPQPLIPNPAGSPLGETFLQIKAKLQDIKGS